MIILLGLILIAIGAFLSFRMEGKAFNRRNAAGVEVFESYSDSLKTKFREGAVKVLAGLILLVGIFLFVGGFFI